MSKTFEMWLEDLVVQAKEQNKDFAYAKQMVDQSLLTEAKVIWIDPPGSFPKEFPPTDTKQDKEAGREWDKAWTIVRCGAQPRPTTISVKVGKFLPGGMPDIKF